MPRSDKRSGYWARLLKEFRHAFGRGREANEVTQEEIEDLRIFAKRIIGRKMEAPAILFFESVRHLNYIGSQIMVMARPFITVAVPPDRYDRYQQIFEKRKSIDALINLIEEEMHSGKKS